MSKIDKDAVLRALDPELFRRLNEKDDSAAPYEKVDHPKHYNLHPAGIECIDVIEEMSFNLGNAVKYIWRSGLKPDSKSDEDLAKAEWYLKRERERLAKTAK